MKNIEITRRTLLQAAAALAAPAAAASSFTDFQIACMTLPYGAFPFERALKGIAGAGYRYVAWGPRYRDSSGKDTPVLAENDPPSRAKQLAAQSREAGLEPVMFFAVGYVEHPNAVEVHKRRIEQAAAGRVPFILTFGSPKGQPAEYPTWIRHLKEIGPAARAAGVTVVIKQHGGTTGTGQDCGRIVSEVADEGIKMFYDAGNTHWYVNADSIPDIQTCWQHVRGFAIKDYRATPKRITCGPGLGEVDHYKLLLPVARTGLKMPLACENISAPYLPRPSTPEQIDELARRSREYLEIVTRGLRASLEEKPA
jgi:sugar phosphate isomerase/epimerase